MIALRSVSAVLAVTLSVAIFTPARADDPFYLGTWKFESAVVAPWTDAPQKSDRAEMKTLIGKTITIGPKAISGPMVFDCKAPKYQISDFSADMLFEGSFGEMQDADKSKDPLQLAASLGFTGTSWKTLETGCEIDWHFVNPTTVAIGLNNYVYTLKKQ